MMSEEPSIPDRRCTQVVESHRRTAKPNVSLCCFCNLPQGELSNPIFSHHQRKHCQGNVQRMGHPICSGAEHCRTHCKGAQRNACMAMHSNDHALCCCVLATSCLCTQVIVRTYWDTFDVLFLSDRWCLFGHGLWILLLLCLHVFLFFSYL